MSIRRGEIEVRKWATALRGIEETIVSANQAPGGEAGRLICVKIMCCFMLAAGR